MIHITCSAVVKNNKFVLNSIYIVGVESYILNLENTWNEELVDLSLKNLQDLTEYQHLSTYSIIYSPIRLVNDSSALSFANFVKNRIKGKNSEDFSKKLFKVLCEVGENYE